MGQRQNNNYGDMMQIMSDIGLESYVNGTQRKELYGLAWFKLHYCSSAICLDVGTNLGNTAIVLASAIKHQNVKIPAKVYTVDNYSESTDREADIERAKSNMASFGIDELLSIHVEDDLTFINSLADASIDMVFDDSDHSYSATLNRLRAYLPKLRPNSLIVGHDYYVNYPGIVKAVDDLRRENRDALSALTVTNGMFWMFYNIEV